MKQTLSVIVLLFLVLATLVYFQITSHSTSVLLPPSSLERWYKPASKRQVWLHTMFSLRRSMQAVAEYAASGDRALLLKWAEKLAKDYNKAAEMVPEWKEDLKLGRMERLLAAVREQDEKGVEEAHRDLSKACKGCHRKYRAVTAALYRAPDFSGLQVENSATQKKQSYADAMAGLSTIMNKMVIAMADQRWQRAQDGRRELAARLDDLAQSCASCHKEESAKNVVLGPRSTEALEALGGLFAVQDGRKAGRALGEIAVSICARCHGIHRTLAELRTLIAGDTGGASD